MTTKKNNSLNSVSYSVPLIFSHNINGIFSKLNELNHFMSYSYPHISIVNIQETKLKTTDPDNIYVFNKFHLIRQDRDISQFSENGGGGLISYVNIEWSKNTPKIFINISDPNIEMLAILCRPNFLPSQFTCIINVNIYIRPQSHKLTANKTLSRFIKNCYKKYPKSLIIICGDANQSRINMLEQLSLTNLINSPTFYPTKSQIDIAYTNFPENYTTEMLGSFGNATTSFHLSYILIPTITCHTKIKMMKTTTKIDKNKLQHIFETTDWSFINDDDVSTMADVCDSYIENAIHQCTTKLRERKNPLNRISPDDNLKNLLKIKAKAIKNNNNTLRNKTQTEINYHVKSIRQTFFRNMTSKELYKFINSIIKGKSNSKLPNIEQANEINDFFTRFNSDQHKDSEIQFQTESAATNNTIIISKEDVNNYFKNIKNHTSSGPSKIPPWVLKEFRTYLSKPYSRIYTKSLAQSTYPTLWKYALVTPIPKKPQATFQEPNLFRPIAVTPTQARILDKIALKILQENMAEDEDPYQFAYKRNSSTIDSLLITVDFIASNIDRTAGTFVKCTFLDYSSAFNTVLQNKLLNYISSKSVNMAQWINSYFKGWKQSVKTNNHEQSNYNEVTVGIPQGGPLSAKMFTYCTNDINNDSLQLTYNKSNIAKYSDDTRVLYAFHGDQNNKEEDQQSYENIIETVYNMSQQKNLKLNPNKSEELTVAASYSPNNDNVYKKSLTLNNNNIPKVTKVKYLGIIITQNLDWTPQINNIVQKTNFIIKNLSTVIPYMSTATKTNVFKTLIIPNILYASEVWGCHLNKNNKNKLHKLMKFYSKLSQININYLITITNNIHTNKFSKSIQRIIENNEHPLNIKLKPNNTITRQRFGPVYCRTSFYQNTFIPTASMYLSNMYTPTLL